MNYTVEINYKSGAILAMTRQFSNYKDAKNYMDKCLNIMVTEDNDEIGINKVSLSIEAA